MSTKTSSSPVKETGNQKPGNRDWKTVIGVLLFLWIAVGCPLPALPWASAEPDPLEEIKTIIERGERHGTLLPENKKYLTRYFDDLKRLSEGDKKKLYHLWYGSVFSKEYETDCIARFTDQPITSDDADFLKFLKQKGISTIGQLYQKLKNPQFKLNYDQIDKVGEIFEKVGVYDCVEHYLQRRYMDWWNEQEKESNKRFFGLGWNPGE
jgi:hypothetical protein